MLFILARLQIVKLPSALALECVVVRFIPVYSAIIKVKSLNSVLWSKEGYKFNCTADDATLLVAYAF